MEELPEGPMENVDSEADGAELKEQPHPVWHAPIN
jgi:hypothetical protein